MHENRHILDVKKEELKKKVLEMADMTGHSIELALQCFKHCDRNSAESIIGRDDAINDNYDQIERNGFYVIASQQPVAHDLREIIVAMRIASEHERIADHAANIARIRLEIEREDMSDLCVGNLSELGVEVLSMYRRAVASYRDLDTAEAESLRTMEMQVDHAADLLTNELFGCMKKDPDLIEDGSRVLWTVHTIERIADRSTNIAEQVIYAVTGHETKIN